MILVYAGTQGHTSRSSACCGRNRMIYRFKGRTRFLARGRSCISVVSGLKLGTAWREDTHFVDKALPLHAEALYS